MLAPLQVWEAAYWDAGHLCRFGRTRFLMKEELEKLKGRG
jgi:hypothetical protein